MLEVAARLILGGVLAGASLAKLASPASSRAALASFGIDGGWYGPVPPAHAGRIGDLVVVCLGRRVALAGGWESPRVARMVAFHGSVTAAEMTVPLLITTSA